ncbi:hypothetical protein [Pseudarthrobacter sp. fls2-241-R2A-127]|uniref:hypothetical protein n=1 Tax=Pseudarthrobacter sp. fls2-241-R2A-127 TaxID=3040303 RepID=UPI002554E33A|nr:hypothetical protein [Pseudarthrobacter sp. fls2-241-R2A-127]
MSRDSSALTRVLSSMDWQLEKKPAFFYPNFRQPESFGLASKLFRPGHEVGVGPVERLMKTWLLWTRMISSPAPWYEF